jgi:hypothetical protein
MSEKELLKFIQNARQRQTIIIVYVKDNQIEHEHDKYVVPDIF